MSFTRYHIIMVLCGIIVSSICEAEDQVQHKILNYEYKLTGIDNEAISNDQLKYETLNNLLIKLRDQKNDSNFAKLLLGKTLHHIIRRHLGCTNEKNIDTCNEKRRAERNQISIDLLNDGFDGSLKLAVQSDTLLPKDKYTSIQAYKYIKNFLNNNNFNTRPVDLVTAVNIEVWLERIVKDSFEPNNAEKNDPYYRWVSDRLSEIQKSPDRKFKLLENLFLASKNMNDDLEFALKISLNNPSFTYDLTHERECQVVSTSRLMRTGSAAIYFAYELLPHFEGNYYFKFEDFYYSNVFNKSMSKIVAIFEQCKVSEYTIERKKESGESITDALSRNASLTKVIEELARIGVKSRSPLLVHDFGRIIAKDDYEKLQYYLEAYNLGYKYASSSIGSLYKNSSVDELRNFDKATEWFRTAIIEHGHSKRDLFDHFRQKRKTTEVEIFDSSATSNDIWMVLQLLYMDLNLPHVFFDNNFFTAVTLGSGEAILQFSADQEECVRQRWLVAGFMLNSRYVNNHLNDKVLNGTADLGDKLLARNCINNSWRSASFLRSLTYFDVAVDNDRHLSKYINSFPQREIFGIVIGDNVDTSWPEPFKGGWGKVIRTVQSNTIDKNSDFGQLLNDINGGKYKVLVIDKSSIVAGLGVLTAPLPIEECYSSVEKVRRFFDERFGGNRLKHTTELGRNFRFEPLSAPAYTYEFTDSHKLRISCPSSQGGALQIEFFKRL